MACTATGQLGMIENWSLMEKSGTAEGIGSTYGVLHTLHTRDVLRTSYGEQCAFQRCIEVDPVAPQASTHIFRHSILSLRLLHYVIGTSGLERVNGFPFTLKKGRSEPSSAYVEGLEANNRPLSIYFHIPPDARV